MYDTLLNNPYFPYFFSINKTIAIIALTYPKQYKKDINPEIQNTDINPINAKQQDLNGFLIYCIAYYTDREYNDTMLQYCIKEDFVRWTKETQALIKKDII